MKFGFILVQYIHHVFSNRLFPLFPHMKIDKFGIVGKIDGKNEWIGREKKLPAKKNFGPGVVAPLAHFLMT